MSDNFENDCLSEDDFKELEKSQDKILDILHAKVRESDAAKEWLNTPLGRSVRKYIATEKMRAMKMCAASEDITEQNKARFDFTVISKVEYIFGAIIVDGQEALQQLEQMHEGDSHEEK